jgi:hypothetical protein
MQKKKMVQQKNFKRSFFKFSVISEKNKKEKKKGKKRNRGESDTDLEKKTFKN